MTTSPEYIDREAIEAYRSNDFKAKKMEPLPGKPNEFTLVDKGTGKLFLLVHTQCLGFGNFMVLPEEMDKNTLKIIKPKIDPASLKKIAMTFRDRQQDLEEREPNINKQEVIDAFSSFYHTLNPDHEYGEYMRELIEKSFEVLQLGPIPPAKFVDRTKKDDETPGQGATP